VRCCFATVARPKQKLFFAKACAALREIHAFSLAFGSVSKLREDLQTPVGFSMSLQLHGVVKIRLAHSTSRTSEKRSQPCLLRARALRGPHGVVFFVKGDILCPEGRRNGSRDAVRFSGITSA
jgi:hypothetical protein